MGCQRRQFVGRGGVIMAAGIRTLQTVLHKTMKNACHYDHFMLWWAVTSDKFGGGGKQQQT